MAAKKQAPRFTATISVSLMVSIPVVGATTFEDALVIAKDRAMVKRLLADDVELVDSNAHDVASVSNDVVWQ